MSDMAQHFLQKRLHKKVPHPRLDNEPRLSYRAGRNGSASCGHKGKIHIHLALQEEAARKDSAGGI